MIFQRPCLEYPRTQKNPILLTSSAIFWSWSANVTLKSHGHFISKPLALKEVKRTRPIIKEYNRLDKREHTSYLIHLFFTHFIWRGRGNKEKETLLLALFNFLAILFLERVYNTPFQKVLVKCHCLSLITLCFGYT